MINFIWLLAPIAFLMTGDLNKFYTVGILTILFQGCFLGLRLSEQEKFFMELFARKENDDPRPRE